MCTSESVYVCLSVCMCVGAFVIKYIQQKLIIAYYHELSHSTHRIGSSSETNFTWSTACILHSRSDLDCIT